MQDTSVPQLIINKLTREQYESIQNPSDTELYVITDEDESIEVDQNYDPTSINPQSGTAVAEAVNKKIENTATGTNALTILGTASTVASGINIGGSSRADAGFSVALGHGAQGNGATSTALGYGAIASVNSSIQIGKGTNSTANSLSVGFNGASTNYQLLDGTTGLIPDERLSENIVKKSTVRYDASTSTLYIGVEQ